jgi:hypothetical protein
LFEVTVHQCSAREISTQNHDAHIAMSFNPAIAMESVANAHTAADLHVRSRFSNRADLESRERRERLKKYTMRNFPQCFDSIRTALR